MAKRILIMDDEPLVLSTMERALSKVGYSVVTASEPKGFSESFSANPFDLLIIDLYIKGSPVHKLAEMAKGKNPGIKLLFVSGSIPEVEPENFLQKPFRIEELRERVKNILNEPS